MRIRVIDLETLGFAPPASIVEIAFIDLDDALREVGRFATFINPPSGAAELLAAPAARAVHHIAPADIAGAPALAEALATMERAHGAPDILVAHNSKFERQWLANVWPGVPWVCTLKTAMRVWPNADSYALGFLRYWLALQTPLADVPAHRALADVLVTGDLLRRLADHASLADQVAWEKQPAALPSMPFGKFRGVRWRDIPGDYLSWIVREMSGDANREDIVFAAASELERRPASSLQTRVA